jgi:Rieske Fe-S protein
MPEERQKNDAYRLAQPRIPGVPDAPPRKSTTAPAPPPPTPSQSPNLPPIGVRVALASGLVLAIALLGSIVARRHAEVAVVGSVGTPGSSSATGPAATPADATAMPVAPGDVATTEELAKPWAAKRFTFHDLLAERLVPAMVVHLPAGGYWAFSLEEPYGKCGLDYVTDKRRLKEDYGYSGAAHPMVVSPCSRSVYDLAQYSSAPSGFVRGEVVRGKAVRPPLAIEIHVEGHRVVAVRME